ncbi:unnamed protein product [Boreogadus saida]
MSSPNQNRRLKQKKQKTKRVTDQIRGSNKTQFANGGYLKKNTGVYLDGREIYQNTDINKLDKFQLFFRSGSGLAEIVNVSVSGLAEEEIELICSPPPLPRQTHSAHEPMGRLDDSGLEALKVLIKSKAPNIIAEYEKSGTISTKNRMLLVRVAVSNLVERRGFYPSSDDKVRLAKNVVTTFPKLSVKIQEHNEGYEHYYDPASHSGFIEMKLRNLRRDMEESQRRYRRKNKTCGTVTLTLTSSMANTDEDVSEWVTLAKRMKPSPENLSTIMRAMDRTYTHRRIWITTQSPSLAEIFNQYPRFVDMPHLLDLDFDKQFEGKADLFLRKWETNIIPKLMKVAALEMSEDLENPSTTGNNSDDMLCFKALQVLTHLLPPTASGRGAGWSRCSVKSAISYLMDFVQPGTSISSLLDNPDPSRGHQPSIVCIGHPSGAAQQYLIVAKSDKIAVPLGDEGLTCAIDKLFKMYWVCNLKYPVQLQSVFSFLEHIYELPISVNKRSKVIELISKLQAIS